MAYDEDLVHRLRELLAERPDVSERRMFGGHAFLVAGHLSVSASRTGGLLARIDPAQATAALRRPHASAMRMRGRVVDGWILVAPEGVRTRRMLAPWVRRSLEYVTTLPPKA